ncbi:aminotransferase class I/II-fold pyridoxal phosphate-dependent enzyme [Streptantibioticus silvisoli]|uniref:Aminotransferase class I/II-fold pyridoxal phosphate-dependent enzyme n=1 Tax=Streptantibioticus silvisoli TaxID=2705255 RepID=A0ABT6WAJ2_9ACTN|nr:aminotransferase class I/II-fold pyridoxal phosphate-dependent enzyme [Streptantibioticus silvisoli]MDI5967236.1 aminotransferase class I/II-fold pyridoxal phosphate-dependent enzyme [Streptantibioticus silvisoli]
MPSTVTRRTARRGSPFTDPRLPVPTWLGELLAGGRDDPPEPAGGGVALRTAAAGFLARHGPAAGPAWTLAGPGPAPLMLALLSATGGGLLLPRPAAPWYAPAARLLGRRVRYLPAPAGCGGVPDPVALREVVRRDGAGRDLLVLAVADDPTGTVAPPELVHQVCEVAAAAGLSLLADETFAGSTHGPLTVVLSPAEMVPDRTVVLRDLAAGALPAAWPAAIAGFPSAGPAAALRDGTLAALAAQGAVLPGPVARAAAGALAEPDRARDDARSAVRLHASVAAAAHAELLRAGALCLPPAAGFHLYPDFGTLPDGPRGPGVPGAVRIADRLPGAVPGGWFGDDPAAARVRIAVPALYGDDPRARALALASADPPAVPHVAEALADLRSACAELTGA